MQKLKRDQGNTFNSILPNLLCIIVVCVFVTLFTSWMANVSNRESLNQICRKYILQMETTGYLTNEMKNNLTSELFTAGMRNITIETDTTTNPDEADYGEDIYLVVSGTMPVFEYKVEQNPTDKFMGLEDPNKNNTMAYWDVYISKSSISKAQGGFIEDVDKYQILLTSEGNGKITYGNKKITSLNVNKGDKPTFKFEATDGYIISEVYLDTQKLNPTDYHANADSSEGYYTVDDGNGVTKYHQIYVIFTPKNNITYYIEHYLMNLDGVTYSLDTREEFIGSTGTTVYGTVKQYEGFTSPNQQSMVITADGKATIQYRYVRNKYSFMAISSPYVNKSGTSGNGEYYYGQTITLKAIISGEPTDAFILDGWTDGTNKYNNSDSFKMPAKNITATPNISIKSYIINYDSSGGTGNIANSNAIGYFDKYTLPSTGFTKSGYELLGWSLAPGAVNPTYKLGEQISQLTTNGTITLYAVWGDLGETTFKVEHYVMNANGDYERKSTDTMNGTTSSIFTYENVYDQSYIRSNIIYFDYMKKDGYEIDVFTPARDGSTVIQLYYTRFKYEVTATSTDHIFINGNVIYNNSYYAEQDVKLTATFDNGYKLKRWEVNSPSNLVTTKTDTTISFKMPAQNTTITAVHELIIYDIKYDLSGGSWPDGYNPYLKYDIETSTFTIPNPVREHYTFIGWTGTHITDGSTALMITTGSFGDINLIAQWLIDRFKVTFTYPGTAGKIYINDREINFINNTSYTEEFDWDTDLNIQFVPEYRSSISYLNLIKSLDGEANVTESLISEDYNKEYEYNINSIDRNYYFELTFGNSEYIIKYHSNNGANNSFTQTASFNQNITIADNIWSKVGYEFKGWSENKNDDTPSYKAGQTVKNIATNPKEVVNLYAVWVDVEGPELTYSVTNNMDNYQTITAYPIDTGSGIKGVHWSTTNYPESQYPSLNYNKKDVYTNIVISPCTMYIYTVDNYLNGVKAGPIRFYQIDIGQLENVNHTIDYEYEWIIAAENRTVTMPTGTREDYEYVGWNKDPNATSGVKQIIATENATYYPIYKAVDATLVNGVAFNTALKQLINTSNDYTTEETTITNISYTTTAPGSGVTTVNVSENGCDVLAYKQGSEIKLYTTAKTVHFNPDSSYMFYNFKGLSALNITSDSKTGTTKMTDARWMFAFTGYNNLTSLNLSAFDTKNVTDMEGMFSNCGYTKLTSFSVGSNFNTAEVTNMKAMFNNFGYTTLTNINLGSKFNTAKVTNMHAMFAYAGYNKLTSLNLGSNFYSTKLKDSSYMFAYTGYNGLTSLNLGNNFTGSEITNSEWMFLGCGHEKMTSLNISKMTLVASNYEGMFINCGKSQQCTITVKSATEKNWITNRASSLLMNVSTDKIIY